MLPFFRDTLYKKNFYAVTKAIASKFWHNFSAFLFKTTKASWVEMQLLEKSIPFAHVKGIQIAQMIKRGIRPVLDTVVQCLPIFLCKYMGFMLLLMLKLQNTKTIRSERMKEKWDDHLMYGKDKEKYEDTDNWSISPSVHWLNVKY